MKKDRKDWLKTRTMSIGGSDSSVILGINPYKSRLELWTEKVSGNVVEKDNPDLHWGKKLEPFIIEEFIEITKRDVESGLYEHENIRHKDYGFMTANLDGVVIDKVKGKGVLECKTKSAFTKWEKEVPDHYFSQIQHYLAVTGMNYSSFAVLDFGKKELFWCDVERDEEFIKNLIKAESEFWDLVISKTPPPPDSSASCERFLRETYSKEEKGKEIDLVGNTEASNWANHLKIIRHELNQLKEHETECKNNLMRIVGDAEIAIGDNYTVSWKSPKDKIVFDVDKFSEEHSELYRKYTSKEKQTRRFSIKFNKED